MANLASFSLASVRHLLSKSESEQNWRIVCDVSSAALEGFDLKNNLSIFRGKERSLNNTSLFDIDIHFTGKNIFPCVEVKISKCDVLWPQRPQKAKARISKSSPIANLGGNYNFWFHGYLQKKSWKFLTSTKNSVWCQIRLGLNR